MHQQQTAFENIVEMKKMLIRSNSSFSHNVFYTYQIIVQQQTAFENIVGKEEIACNEQFLFFLQCFLLNQIIVAHLSIFLTSYLYLLLNWKSPKLAYEVKGYLSR